MRFLITFSLAMLPSLVLGQTPPTPFQTDYCTNYPEGTKEEPEKWKHCCLMHDMFFWAGGSREARNDADLELKQCTEKAGAPNHAKIMYYAVRLGSYSPIKYSSKKWNYAWEGRPSYQALSLDDIKLITTELNSGYENIPVQMKKQFINKLQSYLD